MEKTIRIPKGATDIVIRYRLEEPTQPPPPEEGPAEVLGVDISHHQGAIDWALLASKAHFAFIRANFGTRSDSRFGANWHEAKLSGIPRGAYLYLRNSQDATAQARAFLENISDDWGELPPVVDFEDPINFNGARAGELLRTCCSVIENALGVKPIIYTRASYANQVPDSAWLGSYPLWVANYRQNPPPVMPRAWDKWLFWQFTSSGPGKQYGVSSSRIDLNLFHGNWGEWRAYLNTIKTPPQPAKIDLVPYFKGGGQIYEMRHNSGQQERTQHVAQGNAVKIVKGENQGFWELYTWDDQYIYLIADTSPAPASDGTSRYYKRTKVNSTQPSPFCPRYMHVGQRYGNQHSVQFYAKSDCLPHNENSGSASQDTQLVSRQREVTLPNGLVFKDVVTITGNGEKHLFAKGFGRIGWESPWGTSYVSEVHEPGARPPMVPEVIGCM